MFSIEHILIAISLAANLGTGWALYSHAGKIAGLKADLASALGSVAKKI